MQNSKKTLGLLFICVVASIFLFSTSNVSAETNGSDSMIVSVNVLDFVDIVSINVQDFISFGDVTKDDPISERLKIYVNNTGNTAITVTPELADPSEEIFSNIFFQRITTSEFVQIGNYSRDIGKPASGSYKSAYFYATLDLTNFSGEITQNLINHTAEVIFYALPQ